MKQQLSFKDVLLNWLVSALAIGITAYVLPGVTVDGFFPAFIAAIVLGLINAFLKPVLYLFTLPITIMSLGLFTLVINAFLIMLTSALVTGFMVDGFFAALLFSIILAIVNFLLGVNQQRTTLFHAHRSSSHPRHDTDGRVRVEGREVDSE
ncbi:MAG: hypothetical protein COU08_00590 [Candidatus Harrisonbacteria bacterium CG10_big_fil_rev_8_21_14_0_10_42_17]|uniref:Phage holin family protein n=1 Tax=Candidatus Harrisonbacteria bacterium CG10_big_fil_rev_8_21_14_0_10_42_17 TaxID=1974584 RepID=A0A2M6WJ40_9BACT|nr:MAG: hypothetical protein COU08_00590 [Candidatus Harrisonbacteria bacterium CG10_big_fil_rev_8_21_14_0_10_42_17]